MTLTKQDYIKIANIIKNTKNKADMVEEMIIFFKEKPKFDVERFRDAIEGRKRIAEGY